MGTLNIERSQNHLKNEVGDILGKDMASPISPALPFFPPASDQMVVFSNRISLSSWLSSGLGPCVV